MKQSSVSETSETRSEREEYISVSVKELFTYAFKNNKVGIARFKRPEELPENPLDICKQRGIFDHDNYIHNFFENGLGEFEFEHNEENQEKKYIFIWIHKKVMKELIESKIKEEENLEECSVTIDLIIQPLVYYKIKTKQEKEKGR